MTSTRRWCVLDMLGGMSGMPPTASCWRGAKKRLNRHQRGCGLMMTSCRLGSGEKDENTNRHSRTSSARGLIGEPMTLTFRLYDPSQIETCLDLFDSNCPAFFATEERRDYLDFLSIRPLNYFLGLDGNNVVCAFGYSATSDEYPSLNWIMVIPAYQRSGAGGAMMGQYIDLSLIPI